MRAQPNESGNKQSQHNQIEQGAAGRCQHQEHRQYRQKQPGVHAWLLLPVLAVLLMLAPASRTLLDLIMLGLFIPGLVWLGAH